MALIVMHMNRKNANFHFFVIMISASIYLAYLDYSSLSNPYQSHFWNMKIFLNSETYPLFIFCIMSYIAGYSVLNYHASTPTHPKFAFSFQRKVILIIHILSGYIEMFSFFVGFFSCIPSMWAYIAITAACFGHIPTSIYLWPDVYGIKKLMIPCYFISITTHLYTTWILFQNPSNPISLLKMCIALHLYVWVRVSIRLFEYLHVFSENKYTMAVFFAGFLTIPLLFGPLGNFMFPFMIFMYHCMIDPVLQYFGLSFDQKFNTKDINNGNNVNNNKKCINYQYSSSSPPSSSSSSSPPSSSSSSSSFISIPLDSTVDNQYSHKEYKRDIDFAVVDTRIMKVDDTNKNHDHTNSDEVYACKGFNTDIYSSSISSSSFCIDSNSSSASCSSTNIICNNNGSSSTNTINISTSDGCRSSNTSNSSSNTCNRSSSSNNSKAHTQLSIKNISHTRTTMSDTSAAAMVFQAMDVSNAGCLKLQALIDLLRGFGLSETEIRCKFQNPSSSSSSSWSIRGSSNSSGISSSNSGSDGSSSSSCNNNNNNSSSNSISGSNNNNNNTLIDKDVIKNILIDCAYNDDAIISFDCFLNDWRCIWEYAYHQLQLQVSNTHTQCLKE